jgi:hypothetical protein
MASRSEFVPNSIFVLLDAVFRLDRHAVFPGQVREQDQLVAGRLHFWRR